jgi:hypothetical protein
MEFPMAAPCLQPHQPPRCLLCMMERKEHIAMPMQVKLFTRPLAGSPSGLVEIEQVINAWLAEYPGVIVTHTETHVFFNQETRKNDIVVLIWYRA